ncbi:MAG: patatin-like phospholipase family protein [Cyanobacteria bacterium SZAS-4]|nr:patatin-like phospholipase family protein [Cyanobacteria bacterium SZAS-4]
MRKTSITSFSLLIAGIITVSYASAETAHVDVSQAPAETITAAPAKNLGRPRIGLALGGGGSRGAAHVGVLKVLKEENIPIDLVAGTSIGSVVGGYYAAGTSVDEIEELFKNGRFTKEFTPMPYLRVATEPLELAARLVGYKPYDGLYRGWKFRGYVKKQLNNKSIEQLNIPYGAVVTDVVSGKSCRLTSGDLALAMQASTAVPGLKKPVQIGERLYCDGGLINNVPVSHAREMGADFVIAVDIDETLKDTPLKTFRGLGSMARQALKIQLATFDVSNAQKAEVYIHPDTTGINLVSFKKSDGETGYEAGVAAARAAMPDLKKKLAAMGLVCQTTHKID